MSLSQALRNGQNGQSYYVFFTAVFFESVQRINLGLEYVLYLWAIFPNPSMFKKGSAEFKLNESWAHNITYYSKLNNILKTENCCMILKKKH